MCSGPACAQIASSRLIEIKTFRLKLGMLHSNDALQAMTVSDLSSVVLFERHSFKVKRNTVNVPAMNVTQCSEVQTPLVTGY